jgi:hypothetical protein
VRPPCIVGTYTNSYRYIQVYVREEQTVKKTRDVNDGVLCGVLCEERVR